MEMIEIPGGTFLQGSNDHYIEEGPVRRMSVDAFGIDRTPVTNRDFAVFVAETGYITEAERDPDPSLYPEHIGLEKRRGALVFSPRRSSTESVLDWWEFRDAASWRRPDSKRSVHAGKMDHPVTCVSHGDALAYADWSGKRLPTEAEWEYAARGGLEGAEFSWGSELMPDGLEMANIWYGQFPHDHRKGTHGTTRVGLYPANGYGLVDMIGNVWEWTSSWYVSPPAKASCCSVNLANADTAPEESFDPALPEIRIPRRVVKGGSFLCSPHYCARYRPAARQPQMIDTAAVHIGFRCAQTL